MALIPIHETRLNLSNNNLSSRSTEWVTTLLECILERVLTVDLQNNSFGAQATRLDLAIKKLHGAIKTLLLDTNPLGSHHCIFSLKDLLDNCPKNLLKLSLGNCDLNLANIIELTEGFTKLNQELDELNLANNNLGLRSTDDLSALLSHLPSGLKKLSLAFNQLDQCLDTLAAILANIHCSLEVLDLRGNHLESLQEEGLKSLCRMLPGTVKSLRLSDSLTIDPIQYKMEAPFFLSNVGLESEAYSFNLGQSSGH